MKKNIAMRVAAFLFILTMISTCAFATTFAKYTTSHENDDTARVAKWGVKVDLTDFDVFNETYDGTVSTSNTDKVVAPGTGGTLAGISITGTPEVKVEVKFEATFTITGWTVGSAYYCPIEVTVGSTVIKGLDYASETSPVNAFVTAVEEAIEDYTAEYNANVNLATYAEAPQVSWAWAFEGNDDVKDTALGDAANAGNAPTISLEIKCTVSQID